MNIIGHKHIFLGCSGALVLASVAALSLWGLRLGIDFTGGSLLEIEFSGVRPSAEAIRERLSGLEIGTAAIQPTGERGVILRFRHVDEPVHREMLARISALDTGSSGPVEKRFDAIGPTIGGELRRRALMALGVAIAAIILYIAWAFRHVSSPPHQLRTGAEHPKRMQYAIGAGAGPISSWKYGVAAVAALIHDVLIPTGVFSILGHFRGVEVDALFITALLTILGFSVHDTIVVFDRTRENLRLQKRKEAYAETVNRSVNETMTRSVLTSFTVLLVLAAIFFFGGAATQYFVLALIIGVVFGTYSSIFVASPLLVIWNSLTEKQ